MLPLMIAATLFQAPTAAPPEACLAEIAAANTRDLDIQNSQMRQVVIDKFNAIMHDYMTIISILEEHDANQALYRLKIAKLVSDRALTAEEADELLGMSRRHRADMIVSIKDVLAILPSCPLPPIPPAPDI